MPGARRTVAAGTSRAALAACALLALMTGAALAVLAAPARNDVAAADEPRALVPASVPVRRTPCTFLPAKAPDPPDRFAGTPPRPPRLLVAADIASDPAVVTRATTVTAGSKAACIVAPPVELRGKYDQLAATTVNVRELVINEFWSELNAAGDPVELQAEVSDILVAAARGLGTGAPPGPHAGHHARGQTDAPDIARLRSHVPDGAVRQLIGALPRLIRERDLAPIVQVRASTGSSPESTHATRGPTTITVGYPRPLSDGTSTVNWLRMSDEDDPRLEAARREVTALRREFQLSVEAILGLPLLPAERIRHGGHGATPPAAR